jgi:hypothetical protein
VSVVRRNILITGASSGLGEGMAREFARLGRSLVLCARRADRLEALQSELLAAHPGARVLVQRLDVTEPGEVFRVFREADAELGGLDRVIVNAGIGASRRVGTGHAEANLRTAQTNFVAAVTQCEAAVELFRARNAGHLVTISSVSAMRGFPKHLTTYAATKAGLSALTEGIRAELLHTPIRVSTMLPGYVRTEMTAGAKALPFEVDLATGARALVAAIEREPARAFVPRWPWAVLGFAMRHLPLRLAIRLM